MAKTYTAAGTATAGQVYTAAAHNVIVTDVNNLIVPPMCKITRTTDQSINNITDTIPATDTIEFDTDGMATTGASSRITINTAGVYLVTMTVNWAAITATFTRSSFVAKNAGTGTRLLYQQFSPTTGGLWYTGSVPVSLAVNDYLTPYVYHDRGSAATIQIGSYNTPAASLSAIWIGRTS